MLLVVHTLSHIFLFSCILTFTHTHTIRFYPLNLL